MPFQKYIDDISKRYAMGTAREHTYRPALQNLLEDVIPGIIASNDPARIECGAPDFILSRRKIDVGYIEAKDIGDELDKTEKTEQLKRYRESLDNLILTDYLEFRFFLHGEKVEVIHIGDVQGKSVRPLAENFSRLKTLLIDFAAFQGQTIKSAKKLAEMMAHKARLMRDVFFKVVQDKIGNSALHDQLKAFKKVLVHDMDEVQFADVYAQTIAYGLFTARLHDTSLDDFTRAEALTLIPKSNPFLRQLFHYVAGPDLDDRVVWIVDALCEVYRSTDLRAIMHDFGMATGQNDPILHFYETFLAEYDPKLRKSRGIWYTPEPVVNFIVRAIDDVLKEHFGLRAGLADTSKVKIQVEVQDTDKRTTRRKMVDKEVHKVQLLDVATGTGTFLAEVIKLIYARFKGQEGLWSSYVENDLLPRLHGFELLMASYAMCHMKLDLLLQETGYHPLNPNNPPRVSVYLTNSLEEYHPKVETLFASWLSREANEANRIKKDMPIMVALGNPPYSGESSNKGDWIMDIVDAYKQEPRGGKLKERNSKWLNDDYVKFMRMGEYYIEKNGEGVLAYITNHSYLDNPTFRGMRWHLLNTFDDIYIIDLHGNAQQKETTPEGKPDKNVFDIKQGVAIVVAVKNRRMVGKKPLATVHHADLWGDRQKKYDFLLKSMLIGVKWKKLKPIESDYFFIPKDYGLLEEYEKGILVSELFVEGSMGVTTGGDKERVMFEKYQNDNVRSYSYRPFDTRFIEYKTEMLARAREFIMRNFFKENIALITCKRNRDDSSTYFLSKEITDKSYVSSLDNSFCFPLYIYHPDLGTVETMTPNLNPNIYAQIKNIVPNVTPESLFDYIYAVLHSPEFRKRYAEFLKSDFPRIPYPKDSKNFHALAKQGTGLRKLHLMESEKLNELLTTYPVDGDHEVKKPRFDKGKVWINETQYFGNVSEVAWNFHIGGYQPAQKWLKDRKGRKLTIEDIKHWQRIIVALVETDRIMKEIDNIDFLPNTLE
ncbi:MAG: type ISP restriction/modification enzyme [Deltaproteobacteria bacterium]